MPLQHLAQHLDLALPARRIQPGARPHHLLDGQTGQASQQQRGRRRVPNAHLAQQDGVARQAGHQFAAIADGRPALLGRHGRLQQRIGRACAHPAQHQPGLLRQRIDHAAIHHLHIQSMLAGQHTHRRLTGQDALHHQRGDGRRPGRDALRHQAMIARAQQHRRLLKPRRLGAQDLANLNRQRLQPPQRARRPRLGVQPRLDGRGPVSVKNGRDKRNDSLGLRGRRQVMQRHG